MIYWSNSGGDLSLTLALDPRLAPVLRGDSDGAHLVKYWSNTGQILVKYGQI